MRHHVSSNVFGMCHFFMCFKGPLEVGQECTILACMAALAKGYRFGARPGPISDIEGFDYGISSHGHELWLLYANQTHIRYSIVYKISYFGFVLVLCIDIYREHTCIVDIW